MITKKSLFPFLCWFVLFTSCNDQSVNLPLIDIPGVSEIQNHSSIWIFKETKNNTTFARLNKNNKILNTHWIFNIDKDLPMSEVVPLLDKMQKNRNKDSMHKKEGMLNYFSYADTASKQISLAPFSDKNYLFAYPESNTLGDSNTDTCLLIVEILEDSLKIDDTIISLESLPSIIEERNLCGEKQEQKITLVYQDQTSYQDYLHVKVFLSHMQMDCTKDEYIYTVK